jgi:hypothetical protein
MPITDQIKNYAKKLIEGRPDADALRALIRERQPVAITFRDDGIVPNTASSRTIHVFRSWSTAAPSG